MKRILLVLLLAACGTAVAQNAPLQGISESTDPDKVRDVERRADEIRARQQAASSGASDTAAGAGSATKRDAKRSKHKKMKRGPAPEPKAEK
ncbi:MAG: hypothetical protein Q7U14_15500 [Lacisediminimonas sp.]|nr:hypothetical protein [Lacisediminimonas sp.]